VQQYSPALQQLNQSNLTDMGFDLAGALDVAGFDSVEVGLECFLKILHTPQLCTHRNYLSMANITNFKHLESMPNRMADMKFLVRGVHSMCLFMHTN